MVGRVGTAARSWAICQPSVFNASTSDFSRPARRLQAVGSSGAATMTGPMKSSSVIRSKKYSVTRRSLGLEVGALERERRPLERRLAFELDRLLPLVERVAVALGDTADLGHRALVEPQALGDLLVGETGPIDPLERVAELQHLVLVALVDVRIELEHAHGYFISLRPWAAGHTRMHSKHWAMFVDE